MIANRVEFLEAIIRKLCSQVEISAAWEASNGRKFPANISGHDTHGGEDLTPEEYEELTAIMNEKTVPTTCRKCQTPIQGDQYRFGSPSTGWEHMEGECVKPTMWSRGEKP